MEMNYHLVPLVFYDDYDNCGYLLDIRRGVLIELNERDTQILSAVLSGSPLPVVLQQLNEHARSSSDEKVSEADILALLHRLREQKLVEPQEVNPPSNASRAPASPIKQKEVQRISPLTWRQRLVGAGHIISVLGELCTGGEGIYKAHQYIWKLREHSSIKAMPASLAVALVSQEYWFYRLITGRLERRVAHVIGQVSGNEGLCLIRAFSLCVYLLLLGVPANIVIARPLYGSRNGFKLHAWVEMEGGTPLNERPNIGDGYRCMYAFPFSYRA